MFAALFEEFLGSVESQYRRVEFSAQQARAWLDTIEFDLDLEETIRRGGSVEDVVGARGSQEQAFLDLIMDGSEEEEEEAVETRRRARENRTENRIEQEARKRRRARC